MRTANDNEGNYWTAPPDHYVDGYEMAAGKLQRRASTTVLPTFVCEDEDSENWDNFDPECDCPDCTRPRK